MRSLTTIPRTANATPSLTDYIFKNLVEGGKNPNKEAVYTIMEHIEKDNSKIITQLRYKGLLPLLAKELERLFYPKTTTVPDTWGNGHHWGYNYPEKQTPSPLPETKVIAEAFTKAVEALKKKNTSKQDIRTIE